MEFTKKAPNANRLQYPSECTFICFTLMCVCVCVILYMCMYISPDEGVLVLRRTVELFVALLAQGAWPWQLPQ